MTRPDPITNPRPPIRQDALAAFVAQNAYIYYILPLLHDLSDHHFFAHPEYISWCHVCTLEHYASLLKLITYISFCEC